MASIVIFGGTGYTGRNVAQEAAARGHTVVAVSRTTPSDPLPGVRYETGDVIDIAPRLVPAADAVVAALSPRGDMAGRLVDIYRDLARQVASAGARYVQIGGFSSLRPAADEPRFVEGEVPEQFRAEAVEGDAIREMLVRDAPPELDWVFVSPAGSYGAWAPGERTGSYRVGGEIALFDDAGDSGISGEDFAIAVVDEMENASHHREHIGVAY